MGTKFTIEEKAKRYDEAIERVIELNYVSDKDSLQCKTVERIFPELKEESEDEKMKKIISDILLIDSDDIREILDSNDVLMQDIDAWLEKQGEQNEKMKKDIAEFIFNSREDIKHRYDWIKYLGYDIHFIDKERQCEQKPNPVLDIEIPFGAKDSELQEVSYHIPEGFHAKIEGNKVIIKKGEQNIAWSEEDESNLQGIIDEIEANKRQAPGYDLATYNRYLSWLESIKARYTWKPSDEQIKALNIAIRCGIQLGTWEENALKSLKEQLKKLREE